MGNKEEQGIEYEEERIWTAEIKKKYWTDWQTGKQWQGSNEAKVKERNQ